MSRWARHQWLRFVLVGCVNTSFAYGVYAAFLALGLSYVVANGLSFVISLGVSFHTQSNFVFRNPDRRLIVRYVIAWVTIFVLNIGLIGALGQLGLNNYQAGAVALVPVTGLSYLVQKFLVFGRR